MKKLLLPLLALAALALPARAAIDLEAIKPDGFAHGVVLKVDGYAADKDRLTLADFPVLVRISPTRISGFSYDDSLVSGGGDLCFKAADNTVLSHEVDTWNTSGGESLVWVKLPSMTNGTEFAMFYGASANAATAVYAGRPWGDYTGVWHLNETAPGNTSGGVTISDSTANELHGLAGNMELSPQYDGDAPVGNGRRIYSGDSKTKQGIIVDLSESLKQGAVDALGKNFTASFWIKCDGVLKWHYLIGRMNGDADGTWGIQSHDTDTQLRVWANNDGDKSSNRAGLSKALNNLKLGWHKLDVVWRNPDEKTYVFELYYDGNLAEISRPSTFKSVVQKNSALGIGGVISDACRPFSGYMDEVRLRAFIPTEDWVKADYDTVVNPKFLSTSGEVVSFAVRPAPVLGADVVDTGAAFLQFAGTVTACGGTATAVDVYAKAWPTDGTEPSGWTLLTNGVPANGTFGGFLTGLDPKTEYTWAVKGVNNLESPEDSDLVTGTLETSGVGDAGIGGTAERQLDDFVHTFLIDERGNATYTFKPPAGVTEVDALVVAGGGPGGYYAGGGGGAGGLIYTKGLAVTPLALYTINIGTGGLASASVTAYGSQGGNSSFVGPGVNLEAVGGGAGGNGALDNQTATGAGQNGGSGGGGHTGAGSGTVGQGNDGGTHGDTPVYGGGGGGAKNPGTTVNWGSSTIKGGGGGGDGFQTDISGNNVYYAGGGGGGGPKSAKDNAYGNGGPGGFGGGGMGGQETATTDTATAENGVDGLGGGGGGGSTYSANGHNCYQGGNGGNGVVIIRYGAGGDGVGVVHPTVSLTGLTYDDTTGKATATYRVGWAGDGCDRAGVFAIWGYAADNLNNTNELATAAIGQGDGTFQLPRVTKTVYIRLLATNAGGHIGVSPEVKTLVLFNPAAPVGMVAATPGITKAGFEAVVTALGEGATTVSAAFQVCADKFFDPGTYTTFPVTNATTTLSAPGSLFGAATGLSAQSTYWVRAVLTNDVLTDGEPTAYETDPVSFTTAIPGWPCGAFSPSNEEPDVTTTATTLTAKGIYNSFGEGATPNGSFWLQVATTRDFAAADIVAESDPVAVDTAMTTATFTVESLVPDTDYYVRLRLSNDWRTGSAPGNNKGLGPFRTKRYPSAFTIRVY